MNFKFNRDDLKSLQLLPLHHKINLSKIRIAEWFHHFGGSVCVSFSGGKDSSVLLHIVRSIFPDVPAVYVDTRLDFPEVRQLVKDTPNVIWLKPAMNFRQVIDTYGFCYPSKDVARAVEAYRRNVPWAINFFDAKRKDGSHKDFYQKYLKWKWLVDSDLKISSKCCEVMKELPLNTFHKQTNLHPFIGILACESARRRKSWYIHGCNAFPIKFPNSKPLAFWTEQDILRYIIDFDVNIPSVYGSIIADKHGKLRTTGAHRTGCIFCPIGSHLDKHNKFQRLKISHPNLYSYCMQELGLDDFLSKVGVPH